MNFFFQAIKQLSEFEDRSIQPISKHIAQASAIAAAHCCLLLLLPTVALIEFYINFIFLHQIKQKKLYIIFVLHLINTL